MSTRATSTPRMLRAHFGHANTPSLSPAPLYPSSLGAPSRFLAVPSRILTSPYRIPAAPSRFLAAPSHILTAPLPTHRRQPSPVGPPHPRPAPIATRSHIQRNALRSYTHQNNSHRISDSTVAAKLTRDRSEGGLSPKRKDSHLRQTPRHAYVHYRSRIPSFRH